MNSANMTPVEILYVEDNPGDVMLTREALKDGKVRNNLHHVADGESAIAFLRKEGDFKDAIRPDLILLDLNLPGLDGREVLKEVRSNASTATIPVVVLTSSEAESDIVKSYQLSANCHVTKPVQFDSFCKAILEIESFWFTVVKLPIADSTT